MSKIPSYRNSCASRTNDFGFEACQLESPDNLRVSLFLDPKDLYPDNPDGLFEVLADFVPVIRAFSF